MHADDRLVLGALGRHAGGVVPPISHMLVREAIAAVDKAKDTQGIAFDHSHGGFDKSLEMTMIDKEYAAVS